jgi:non-homologous end joining protein Ku
MARAIARTTLSLGDLLGVPIGIVAATGADEVKFDTAFPDGAPRVQQYVHPERTRLMHRLDPARAGEIIDLTDDEWSRDVEITLAEFEARVSMYFEAVEVPEVVTETIKGVRVGDTFRPVPTSEIEYASAATRLDSVQLLEFIDYRKVPTDRLTGSFWIQPDVGFDRPLAVLMAAMRADGRAMLVKWAARSRQRLGVIRVRKTPDGDALMLNGVVFAADWREPDARVLAPGQVEQVDARAVKAAREIIESYAGVGEALETAADDLPGLLTEVVERAHDGLYDDPARVLEFAVTLGGEGLDERRDRLVLWAETRWPELAERREEVERVIAEGGEGVGEKLAAIIG